MNSVPYKDMIALKDVTTKMIITLIKALLMYRQGFLRQI